MKWHKIAIISVFITCLVVPIPLSLAIYRENNEDEKREREPFPTTFSNDYFNKLNNFFVDHSPFRDNIIKFYKNINKSVEDAYYNWLLSMFYKTPKDPDDPIDPVDPVDPEDTRVWPDEQKYSEAPEVEHLNTITGDDFDYDSVITYPYKDEGLPSYPSKIEGSVIYGRDKWLFYYGEGSLEDYRGNSVYPYSTMVKYRKVVKELTEYCDSKGIKFTMFIAPNKEQVISDKMPTYTITNRAKKTQRLTYFMRDGGVNNFFYPLDLVIKARDVYDTYYMQDTHWNSYGAAVGVNYLANKMGLEPDYDYKITKTTKVGGDLAQMLGVTGDEYEDYKVEYKPDVTIYPSYVAEHNEEVYNTDLTNGVRCLMFGDSFKNSISPLLCKNFQYYSCIHNKTAITNKDMVLEPLSRLKAGDHLLIESVERADSVSFTVAKNVLNYLKEINGD